MSLSIKIYRSWIFKSSQSMCRSKVPFTWAADASLVLHIHCRATFRARSPFKTNAFSSIEFREPKPNYLRSESWSRTCCWRKSAEKFST